MKELTIEEKAQRYDEAIEIAKDSFNYPDYPGFIRADVVFPELKESEDERIRKWLIHYFKEVCDNVSEKEKKGVIDWLEKQGEKEVESTEEFETFVRWFVKQRTDNYTLIPSEKDIRKWADLILNHAKQELKKQGENNMGISEATKQELENNLHKALEKETPESCNEFLDKQGGQNPVVIIPKFRVGDEIETSNEKSLTITKIDEKGYWSEDLFICGFDEECIWDLVGQNRAWSEEDEAIYRKCICAMRASACGFPEEEKFVEQVDNWLKSIKDRVQPKQEWSDYDECMLANLIDDPNCSIDSEYVHWLKSLKDRYTWKPSEEQIMVLAKASETYCDRDKNTLYSLYNDLKKLREE